MATHEQPPRERILAAVERLFYREGIRGVGVERVASEAETTKMSLYRHFPSKDDLITEWLAGEAGQQKRYWKELERLHPDDPRAQIRGLLEGGARCAADSTHRGCALVNSLAELPDREHPARRVIDEHKAAQLRWLEERCERAGLLEPATTALELHLALEGALVAAQYLSRERVAATLRELVERRLAS